MSQLSKKERSFFKAAQAVSQLSDHRVKIGCIIGDKHQINSSGHNSNTKCHSVQAKLDSKHFKCFCVGKVHAETDAIIPLLNMQRDFSGATLYTYRELKDGSLAMARPCSRCMELIKRLNISKIKYTTDDGYAVEYLED